MNSDVEVPLQAGAIAAAGFGGRQVVKGIQKGFNDGQNKGLRKRLDKALTKDPDNIKAMHKYNVKRHKIKSRNAWLKSNNFGRSARFAGAVTGATVAYRLLNGKKIAAAKQQRQQQQYAQQHYQ